MIAAIVGLGTVVVAVGLLVAVVVLDDDEVQAWLTARYGPPRKASVPGPRGKAGDPARYGSMLPCPVPEAPPTSGAHVLRSPGRAGDPDPLRKYRDIAIAHVTLPPIWKAAWAAREGRRRGVDTHYMSAAEREQWPWLEHSWQHDSGLIPVIRDEVAA